MTIRPPPGGSRPPERPSTHPFRSSPPPSVRAPSFPSRPVPTDYDLVSAARRVVEGALGVVPGDTLVVATDMQHADLGLALVEAARALGARSLSFELDALDERPFRAVPADVALALEAAQASVLVMSDDEQEGHFRREFLGLVREHKLRHAHMVGVTRRSLIAGFSVDPTRVLDATRAVRMRLRPDSTLHLKTTGGSDLTVKLSPKYRWAEHVGVIRPGRWENLPTGELLTTPESVDGVFVCDASIGGHFVHKGLIDRTPVRLEIAQGVVTRATCVDRALQRSVEEYLRSEPLAARVGTVVVGTNVGMLTPIGEMVCDQNLPGLHLSLGNTFSDITGAEPGALSQLTLTTSGADIDLDGTQLLRAGRYLL